MPTGALVTVGVRLFGGAMVPGPDQMLDSTSVGWFRVAPSVNGCDYIGPTGMAGMRGYPAKVLSSERSYDLSSAKQLWQMSEEMSGVHYDFQLTAMTP